MCTYLLHNTNIQHFTKNRKYTGAYCVGMFFNQYRFMQRLIFFKHTLQKSMLKGIPCYLSIYYLHSIRCFPLGNSVLCRVQVLGLSYSICYRSIILLAMFQNGQEICKKDYDIYLQPFPLYCNINKQYMPGQFPM